MEIIVNFEGMFQIGKQLLSSTLIQFNNIYSLMNPNKLIKLNRREKDRT